MTDDVVFAEIKLIFFLFYFKLRAYLTNVCPVNVNTQHKGLLSAQFKSRKLEIKNIYQDITHTSQSCPKLSDNLCYI